MDNTITPSDGGPAFPQPCWSDGESGGGGVVADLVPIGRRGEVCGMSLRDWFAGQTLNAIVGNEVAVNTVERYAAGDRAACYQFIADAAYRQADAMLALRAKAEGAHAA